MTTDAISLIQAVIRDQLRAFKTAELGVVTEQVRRYERAYRDWLKEYPNEPLAG